MNLLHDFGLVALGLLFLVLAGDALVRGAVNLSLRLGIPPLIVGLTVVAFGTSAPELLVSLQAALEGAPGIALGNVVGSNIANVLLVMGVPALIAPIVVRDAKCHASYLMMIGASVLFIALANFGPMTWWHGLILLAGLGLMLFDNYRSASDHRREARTAREAAVIEPEELEGVDPHMPGWKIALFLVVGIIGLPLGADFLVDGASSIARDFGVSEEVIGLTLVAVGTSLPELATTTAAAFRREAGMAVGNVIGSNIFNLLGIIGVTALIAPLPFGADMLNFDLWVMLGVSLAMLPFVFFGWIVSRLWGFALLGMYVAYVMILFI
jgi:cation:H+ antiporter